MHLRASIGKQAKRDKLNQSLTKRQMMKAIDTVNTLEKALTAFCEGDREKRLVPFFEHNILVFTDIEDYRWNSLGRVLTAAELRITRLLIHAAFVAQMVIVLINAVGTLYGLPLSGTHLSVSCLVGAGLASKTKIDYKMCRNVILYWFLTLPGSAFFTIAVAYISTLIFA